ncbi:MAG: hypothetical protein WC584_00635 [Candidatus Pacearchaeota archaeon]
MNMKIQKFLIFVLQKQEVLEEIGNFLPFTEIRNFCPTENRKNKKVFHLSKSRRFEDKKFSVPFKTGDFEGYKTGSFESKNRKFEK